MLGAVLLGKTLKYVLLNCFVSNAGCKFFWVDCRKNGSILEDKQVTKMDVQKLVQAGYSCLNTSRGNFHIQQCSVFIVVWLHVENTTSSSWMQLFKGWCSWMVTSFTIQFLGEFAEAGDWRISPYYSLMKSSNSTDYFINPFHNWLGWYQT